MIFQKTRGHASYLVSSHISVTLLDCVPLSYETNMELLRVLSHADVRRVILDFLCSDAMITFFCTCQMFRLPRREDIQEIKQCYLSWLNSSGVDTRLLQIFACPVTRNAVTDFLYAHNLVLTYLSCRTMKLGFLDDMETVKLCWLRWWDTQRDKWGQGDEEVLQTDEESQDYKSTMCEDDRTALEMGPLGPQTSVPPGADMVGYLGYLRSQTSL